jgi:hypothetical protein
MLATLIALTGLFSPFAGVPGPTAVSPAEFQSWFAEARRGILSVPAEVERNARRFRYVFVGGFNSERMPGYFAQNARELRARGVPRRSIHFIYPSSHRSIEENGEEVRMGFHEVAGHGPEPLVVLAHSRGACDALAFALREPGFVRDRVAALFLVQGPFGGTVLAEFAGGEGPPLDGRMPWRYRVAMRVLRAIERFVSARGWHGGLPDLTRAESRRFWARLLNDCSDAVPVVGPKTYFIRSETTPVGLGLFRRAAARYLTAYDRPNDGVVAVDDQRLPGIGTDLGVLDCGHDDLTGRTRQGRAHRGLRTALIDSILMAVGKAAPEGSVVAQVGRAVGR